MKITELKAINCVILEITGRLDTTNFTELDNRLNALIDQQQERILLDCSGMDYISSSGLRILLMALKKIALAKGVFALCGLQANIREIFEISGFSSIFRIYPTAEDALKDF